VRTVEHWFQACKATSRLAIRPDPRLRQRQTAKHAGRHTAVIAATDLSVKTCNLRSSQRPAAAERGFLSVG
jgi:hypothetical protein